MVYGGLSVEGLGGWRSGMLRRTQLFKLRLGMRHRRFWDQISWQVDAIRMNPARYLRLVGFIPGI